jgi:elongator complex protein 4
MEEDLVKTVQVSCFTTSCSNDANTVKQNANNPDYNQLLQNIQSHIESGGFETGVVSEKRNILRIAIHSLGSPLWGENGGITPSDDYNPALLRFLLGLRALMRSAYAACVITIPTHLFCDEVYVHKLERFCDTVVEMDSFVGSDKEKNPVYKDYHGLFHIKQLPSLNSLTCNMPETLDLAFKLRRKKFTIEKLHLPPDLSDTVNRDQEDPVARLKPEAGCGVMAGKNKLDF